ncbi:MAG: hypothetical protein ACC742_04125 [Thermoanaerobaculales bacterium]
MSKCRDMMFLGAAAILGALLAGCSSSSPVSAHTTAPGVTQVGQTMVRSVGADLSGILGYNFANASLGDEWLIVDLALTGLRGESVEVKQAAISVRTPDGISAQAGPTRPPRATSPARPATRVR